MTILKEKRLNVIRQFLKQKFSYYPLNEPWDKICQPDIVHVLRVPTCQDFTYPNLSKVLECHGIGEVATEAANRHDIILKVLILLIVQIFCHKYID